LPSRFSRTWICCGEIDGIRGIRRIARTHQQTGFSGLNQKGLSNLSVEFFNAKGETSDGLRERLMAKVVALRASYASELGKLEQAAEKLSENRANEQVRLVFEEMNRHLHTWIDNNRSLPMTDEGVQKPLISAIDGTRYASTVRAAVRRYGDWYNLDYYHHLAHGVRRLGVEQIGKKIDDLKVIVNNLMNNEELSPTKEFLERAVSSVGAAVDEAYKQLQTAGRETFKQTLEQDFEFWRKCEERWGKGQGYRDAISEMTDVRFQKYEEAHRLVMSLITQEWAKIIAQLEGMLMESEGPLKT
jgi:hypothetical protein